MISLLPDSLPPAQPLPPVLPAQGEQRGRVVLLLGCVQQVLAPAISYAAAHVLAANGVEVIIPEKQGCCGSILHHVGEDKQAQQMARQNFDLIPDDIDAIITTAAGCGSGMKEYELLFKHQPDEETAIQFSSKVQDFSAYLAKLGLREPQGLDTELVVAYQDACHLVHAQGHYDEPRSLLNQIPKVRVVSIQEEGMCCGSAGTYNIDQPEIAHELGQRKVKNIVASKPDVVVSGNIGCMTQIGVHMDEQGHTLPVMHIAELLYRAYS